SVLYDVSIDYLLGNDSTTDKAPSEVDIADPKNDTIMTFEGRPIPPEDL
ncbi:MAG TPA: transcriptional regulator, partial [Lactobacillus sp.]|nr:transcriptional regulator [Lactobacillus sp.]